MVVVEFWNSQVFFLNIQSILKIYWSLLLVNMWSSLNIFLFWAHYAHRCVGAIEMRWVKTMTDCRLHCEFSNERELFSSNVC